MFDFIAGNLWSFWLIIAIVCMIIELTSFDFYITCFAIGALGAMLAALIHCPLWLQILVWAVVAVLSICFIRPVLTNHLHKPSHKRASNAEALMGKHGVVTQKIEADGYGYVKIDGDEWRSVSAEGGEIGVGQKVEVVARESIILTVRPIA